MPDIEHTEPRQERSETGEERAETVEPQGTGLLGAAVAIGGAVVAGILARKLSKRGTDGPDPAFAGAFVDVVGFAFFGDAPDRLPAWSTPELKQYTHAQFVALWPTLAEEARAFYTRMPETRSVLFDRWTNASPAERLAWVTAAQDLFPAKKAEFERQRVEVERQRVAQADAARRYEQQAAARAAARARERPPAPVARRAAASGPCIDPFLAAMSGSIATTARLQQQQLNINTGARGPGMAG